MTPHGKALAEATLSETAAPEPQIRIQIQEQLLTMLHVDGGVAAADAVLLPPASPEPLLEGVIAAAADASPSTAEASSLLIVDSAGGVIIAAAGDASPSTPESSSLLRIADSAVAGVEVLPEDPHGQRIQSGSKADLPRQIRGRSESHHGQILIASTIGSIEDHAGGPHVNSSGVSPHVMLSYEWGSQKNVLLIKKELERSGEY